MKSLVLELLMCVPTAVRLHCVTYFPFSDIFDVLYFFGNDSRVDRSINRPHCMTNGSRDPSVPSLTEFDLTSLTYDGQIKW